MLRFRTKVYSFTKFENVSGTCIFTYTYPRNVSTCSNRHTGVKILGNMVQMLAYLLILQFHIYPKIHKSATIPRFPKTPVLFIHQYFNFSSQFLPPCQRSTIPPPSLISPARRATSYMACTSPPMTTSQALSTPP